MRKLFEGAILVMLAALPACDAEPDIATKNSILELQARTALRRVLTAELEYKEKFEKFGSIKELEDSQILPLNLAGGKFEGYSIDIKSDGFMFTATASPENPEGLRSYRINPSGVIEENQPGQTGQWQIYTEPAPKPAPLPQRGSR